MAKSITNRVIENARSKGVTVYTRRQWGSLSLPVYQWRRKYRKHSLLPVKPADTLWQHITVTYDTGKSRASFKKDMRTLERIGNERFSTGVSYNFVIDAVTGEVGLGQSLDAAGAHTLNDKNVRGYSFNQNYVSLAISFIGMPGVKVTQKAGNALVSLIKACVEEGALTPGFDYNPHSMVAYKSCPTPNIQNIMRDIRIAVARPVEVDESLAFRVGTFNIGPGDIKVRKAMEDINSVASMDLDFFGLQEVNPAWSRAMEEQYPTLNAVRTCVYNKARWKLLDSGEFPLSPRTFVGRVPKKRSWIGAKDLDWVKLENRESKKVVYHANVHLVASRYLHPLRAALHNLEMRAVAKWMESHKDDATFVTGDFNVDHIDWKTRGLFGKFKALGFTPNWTLGFVKPTFGARKYYDAIWSNVRARKHVVVALNSDHNGVVSKYSVEI